MKEALFKEVGYSLASLIEAIDVGNIGLPDIQRPFVWNATKVRDLFDSMYKGFPVGYLLFWANSLPGSRTIGSGPKQKAPNLLIVDGQQRLTSLYAVLKAKPIVWSDYSIDRLYIAFRPRDGRFEVADAAIRRDPEYIPDISQLWVSSIGVFAFVKQFLAKLREQREVAGSEEDELAEAINRLHGLLAYPFTALELASSIDEEQVAEVFVRINSKGVALNQADFILTLMSVFWDEGRMQLEQFCRSARQPSTSGPSPFNYFIQPQPDQLLRPTIALGFRRARLEHVYSILRGKDLDTGQFSDERREKQFATLEAAQREVLNLTNWHEFLKCLMQAGFRSSAMITSQTAILYSYGLYLIGRCDFHLDHHDLRNLIGRWFFFASLTGRYSSSPESTMEEDLSKLRNLKTAGEFEAALDQTVDTTLTDDYWSITLPAALATSSARTPSLFAYYAALNLLDARTLLSKLKVSELLDPVAKAKKAALERHHLFPRNYLKSIEITELRDINQIANFALLEWADNIDISDDPPSTYFPKFVEERHIGPSELASMQYWHALPNGWQDMAYNEFLAERRTAMAAVTRDGFARLPRAAEALAKAV